MKRKFIFVLLSVIFFSSSFLGSLKEEVEALPCNPGNFTLYKEGANGAKEGVFTCTKLSTNKNTLTADEKFMAMGPNGMENAGANGPEWVKKFSKFILGLTVVVAYFSEVVAMLTIAYASFLYTTSEGDTRKMRQSKMLILYAFVGMFIGAFSLVISRMVGGAF